MKKQIFSFFLFLCTFSAYAQIKSLDPVLITLPEINLVECEQLVKLANESYSNYKTMSQNKRWLVDIAEYDPTLMHFYGVGCSWYCGGQIDTIQASGSLAEKYKAENIHDFSITTAWIEGKPGSGKGEFVRYIFPGECPRITDVLILNGYTKDKITWRNNGRVKKLLMYYHDKPYAILNLRDTRDCQKFSVGILGYEDKETAPAWSIKFEILEVYAGEKYQDTAITEIYFDGIDVH
jgi:hypothetical protein